MRIKGAGGVVRELCGDKITGESLVSGAASPRTRGCEPLKLFQRTP